MGNCGSQEATAVALNAAPPADPQEKGLMQENTPAPATSTLTKEQRQAKVKELRGRMEGTLTLLRECQDENKKNMLSGKLDSPNLGKVCDALPTIKLGAAIAAECVIPPPGGHCVKIALDIAEQVIKELRSNQVMMGLAASCVEHILLAMEDHKIQALELGSDAAVRDAFARYKACIDDIQKFIWEAAGKDSMWIMRLLVLDRTQKQLEKYKEELERVSQMLQLSVNIGSYAFLAAQEQAKEDVDAEIPKLMEKYPGCSSMDDLLSNPDACKEVAAIMGRNLGPFEGATLTAIDNINVKRGTHTLIENKSLRYLWTDHFNNHEEVKWKLFWEAFPRRLKEEQEALEAYFKDERKRKEFELVVDQGNPETIDISEVNAFFHDDTSLNDLIKTRIADYMETQGAVNQINENKILQGITVARPQQQDLMKLMQEKRLVVVQGVPGEGKFIAACQAGQALFRPSKKEDPTSVRGYFQAIYTADLSECKTASSLDSILRDCFQKIPRSGDVSDHIQAVLNVLFGMDSDERPYRVLLILNHAEEVPEDILDQFCTRLSSILFQDGSQQPTNFSIVLSSRTEQSRLKRNTKNKQLSKEYADFCLNPLPIEIAAKIFQHEAQIVDDDGTHVDVSDEDAQTLAAATGGNPKLLHVLARSLDDVRSFKRALKAPMRHHATQEAFDDALLACFTKLQGGLTVLLLIVEVFPTTFKHDMLYEVLSGWYEVEDRDELECKVDKDLKAMLAINLIQKASTAVGTVYHVVPMVRDYAKFLLQHPPAASDETLRGHIRRAKEARPMILQNFTSLVLDIRETNFMQSLHAYKSTFPKMAANKPHLQKALSLVVEEECLHNDEAEVWKALRMLSTMVYDTKMYDLEQVQDICLKLFELCPGNRLVKGMCLSTAAAFFSGGKDERHGHQPSLKRADQALEILPDGGGEQEICARVVALRSKGLILRDLHRDRQDLDIAISCHKQALELLKPLAGVQRAQIETALNLAELSGTLDYVKAFAEGVQAGKEAIQVANNLFTEPSGDGHSKHPITALAYGSLGYNLKNNGDAQGAFEVHKKAYEIRHFVCGALHQETAMSIQQMGLCYLALKNYEEAEARLVESLKIREQLQKSDDMKGLIGNSLVELAKLYKEWGKKELAIEYYKRTIDTRRQIFKLNLPKIQEPCKDLIELLREIGDEEAFAHFQELVQPQETSV